METIVHLYDQAVPPVKGAGGSSIMIDRLCNVLHQHGHKVYMLSPQGETTAYLEHVPTPPNPTAEDIKRLLPAETDIVVYHGGFSALEPDLFDLSVPVVSRVHSNGNPRSRPNEFFNSLSHASGHQSDVFIHNGHFIDDYPLEPSKGDYLLFMGKVRRSKKGVDVAIRVAKRLKSKLVIAGGRRMKSPETWLPINPLIKSIGYVSGKEKLDVLKNAKALLFPVRWEEPFGNTMIEAMACGTPVIAFRRGAVPEVVVHGVTGFICDTEEDMVAAVSQVHTIDPRACRDHVKKNFDIEVMYQKHIALYRRAISGERW